MIVEAKMDTLCIHEHTNRKTLAFMCHKLKKLAAYPNIKRCSETSIYESS